MTTTQWTLNLLLLAWVLMRNLGTRQVTTMTFLTPLALVTFAALAFLRHIPTDGNDLVLDALGVTAGLALGAVAACLTQVRRVDGDIFVTAGAAFAAVWVAAIGGRVAFAEWATHSGARTVGEFSMRHQITGADAWTTAFVLMALAMVLMRTVASALAVRATQALVRPGVAQSAELERAA